MTERLAEERYMGHPAQWSYDEMYKFWHDDEHVFEDLTEDQRVNLINIVGFIIWKEPDGLAVQDLEGADLGNIEDDRFDNTSQICRRIEHYFSDFFEEY